jgi:putative ABC transport system ATP-binding protein
MSYLSGEHLVKQYGTGEAAVLAVKDISFEIEAGEFVAVMGESGSGKSTLLSIVGVLNTPTSGRLVVSGSDVYRLGQEEQADFRKASLGFVFQSFHLIPYLTLAENVMLPLATMKAKTKKKLAMAEEALARVGLLGKAGRLPNQISGGEQERVAIARAIVNRPPILLADEPTGNLDSKTGADIMKLLTQLNGDGTTVVMVTHSVEYARHAQRILLLSDGQLVQETRLEKGLGSWVGGRGSGEECLNIRGT